MSAAGVVDEGKARPRLRGVAHTWGFVAFLVFGPILIAMAPTAGSRAALSAYVVGMATMFGVSALYHRGTWGRAARAALQRLDHSAIYVAIAGSYTPVALLALSGWSRPALFGIVWGGALAGIAVTWLRPDQSGVLGGTLYLVVGWAAVFVFPQFFAALGPVGFALMLGGGVCYTVGAVVLFTRRPDPWPATFGYHELWHALTLVAAALQLMAVAFIVAPLAGTP